MIDWFIYFTAFAFSLHLSYSENSDAVSGLNSIFKQQNEQGGGGEAIAVHPSSPSCGLILSAADKESDSDPLRQLIRLPETPIFSGFGSLILPYRCPTQVCFQLYIVVVCFALTGEEGVSVDLMLNRCLSVQFLNLCASLARFSAAAFVLPGDLSIRYAQMIVVLCYGGLFCHLFSSFWVCGTGEAGLA